MAIGLMGKKLGMTHVYDEHGRRMGVTAIQAGPCTVVGRRVSARHGYEAVQLGFERVDASKLNKPKAGQFKKAGVEAFRYVREFRLAGRNEAASQGPTGDQPDTASAPNGETEEPSSRPTDPWAIGQQLTVEVFQDYELVDVIGTSVGRGFQGGMKRWNWRGGPASHGSMSHRAPGSIGSSTFPARVVRGHRLPGHMGRARVTVQNVRIVRRDPEHHLLLVEGAIPGAEQGLVVIKKSAKRPGAIRRPHVAEVVAEVEDTKAAKEAAKKAKARKK